MLKFMRDINSITYLAALSNVSAAVSGVPFSWNSLAALVNRLTQSSTSLFSLAMSPACS